MARIHTGHRILAIPPPYSEIDPVFGAIVEAPGTRFAGRLPAPPHSLRRILEVPGRGSRPLNASGIPYILSRCSSGTRGTPKPTRRNTVSRSTKAVTVFLDGDALDGPDLHHSRGEMRLRMG